jgi:hypothetical protein
VLGRLVAARRLVGPGGHGDAGRSVSSPVCGEAGGMRIEGTTHAEASSRRRGRHDIQAGHRDGLHGERSGLREPSSGGERDLHIGICGDAVMTTSHGRPSKTGPTPGTVSTAWAMRPSGSWGLSSKHFQPSSLASPTDRHTVPTAAFRPAGTMAANCPASRASSRVCGGNGGQAICRCRSVRPLWRQCHVSPRYPSRPP